MINWEYLAINFIKQSGNQSRENGIGTQMQNSMDILKRLSGAYMVLFIEVANDGAVIRYATSPYLQDVPVDELKTFEILNAGGHVFIKDITKTDPFYINLFPALCSAAFIPIHSGEINGVLAMGWSAIQDFDHSFGNFADVVQLRMQELLELAQMREQLLATKKINSAPEQVNRIT